MKMTKHLITTTLCAGLIWTGMTQNQATAADEKKEQPAAKVKPADMSKPVQVYILLGQSNMFGFGKVNPSREGNLVDAVQKKGLYPYLVDENKRFVIRNDVRYVGVTGNKGKMKGGTKSRPMGIPHDWAKWKRAKIGPEEGIGWALGDAVDAPVLILKSCIGNRSLGWDLLSPSSKAFEHEGKKYPGYNETPNTIGTGKHPEDAGWYAGVQYDTDVAHAKKVLADVGKMFPGATKYEVAGFFFWQGTKDGNPHHSAHYERHLVNFIKDLRKEFNAPNAKFVVATLGQSVLDENGKYKHEDTGNGKVQVHESYGKVIEAQMAVDGETGKYPEFKDNVATVYTHPVSKGGHAGQHYNLNAETYMNVGEEMGKAMVELLKTDKLKTGE